MHHAVEQHFAPRMRQLGFELARREPHGARFERGPAVVEVNHDAVRAGQVDVWLGRTDREDVPIALEDALQAVGCPAEAIAALTPMQTADEEVLGRLLARAAETLAEHGRELLADDGAALDRAFAWREAQAAEFEAADIAPVILEEAEAAWAAKDFDRLRALLEPVRNRLDSRRARRLAFAESRYRRGTRAQ